MPDGKEVVVTEKPGGETVIDRLAEAALAGMLESVTVTVKLEVPEVLGLPVIAPLEAPRLSPAGSDPEVIAQV